jgi:ATP-dependent helicase/nuclease subunit A
VAAHGPDLHGFLELVGGRAGEGGGDPHASEAPVESEALDAVRLMTIHRAKGLEFEIVCVADLGRGPWGFSPLIRAGRDGRLGLRLSRPGTERPWSTLAHDEIGEQAKAAAAAEERRLFYVAMTRARERLILSGAANLAGSWANGSGAPIGWLGPALVPGLTSRVDERSGVADGVRFRFVVDAEDQPCGRSQGRPLRPPVDVDDLDHPHGGQSRPRPAVGSLSYSSLATFQRCGYRFYAERVLGLPPAPDPAGSGERGAGALTPAERGSAVHTLLERLDFRRPLRPTPAAIAGAAARPPTGRETTEIGALIERFGGSEICARLARATRVAREQPFAFTLGPTLVTGALDAVAKEELEGSLVVDYKTDRLEGRDPAAVVAGEYGTQRLIYALAVLSSGAPSVEVAHVFLEAPETPVVARYEAADRPGLERELAGLAAGVLDERFTVTEAPYREVCQGCPAEGGLCSWPLAMTRRQAPDRLF